MTELVFPQEANRSFANSLYQERQRLIQFFFIFLIPELPPARIALNDTFRFCIIAHANFIRILYFFNATSQDDRGFTCWLN